MVKTKKLPEIVKLVRTYKPPAIDWSCQKVISHSQMTKYNGCQYRWGLEYRDGFKIPSPSINLVFGVVIHEVIQSYLTTYYDQSKASADRLDLISTFKTKFKQEYVELFIKNNKIHFSNSGEMDEYCLDGIEILKYFKKKVDGYFSKRGYWLVGCEIPISYNIIPNVFYNGFLDLVLYHEPTNTIEIIDLKTSTGAWYDKSKKDENKISQLILYKKLFSDQFKFPIENVEIKFLILKRKIKEDGDFPEKRFQEFVPASGKGKITKYVEMLNNFAYSTFDEYGILRKDKFKKTITENSCRFCQFKDRQEICDRGTPFKKTQSLFSIF